MALFDLSAAESAPEIGEVPAVHWLANRISETSAWQSLCETPGDAAAARLKISIGPQGDPWTDDRKTRDELESILLDGQLVPAEDEPHTVLAPQTLTECPLQGGTWLFYVRRQVRYAELAAPGGLQDAWLFFCDRVSALLPQTHVASKKADPERPILRGSRRLEGPKFGDNQERSTQGDYLWTLLAFDWGDLEF